MNHKELIGALYYCAAQCDNCYEACLSDKKHKAELVRCMRLNKDCTELCKLTASFVERTSENEETLLETCIHICENCARECEKHDHDHCQNCARACRSCAEACRKYLKAILSVA